MSVVAHLSSVVPGGDGGHSGTYFVSTDNFNHSWGDGEGNFVYSSGGGDGSHVSQSTYGGSHAQDFVYNIGAGGDGSHSYHGVSSQSVLPAFVSELSLLNDFVLIGIFKLIHHGL